MLKVLARILTDAVLVATVLFIAAGTFAWPRAWALITVMLIARIWGAIAVYRVNPALLRERATEIVHSGQPPTDRLILIAFMATAFVGLPAIAALDAFRWRVFPGPPPALAGAGLCLFALGWTIIAVALRTNPFAITVVRLHTERQHRVVDNGIYSVIRHPMYAGNPLVNVGVGLWLGSYAAVLFALIPLVLLIARIKVEERFLNIALPGYGEYVTRVPYRLIPGVW